MKMLILAASAGLTALPARAFAKGTPAAPAAVPPAPPAPDAVPAVPTETPEAKTARLAAEQAVKDQAKAEAKAKKDAEKLAAKQTKDQAAETKKAEREAAKAAKVQEREAAKATKVADKEAAKVAAAAQRDATRQPEANGIRRPKPETTCGKAWAVFDEVSRKNGTPASITETLPVGTAQGINEATMRTQYAHWRKFHGVSGRIDAPKPVQEPGAVEPAPVTPAPAPAAPVVPPVVTA